MPPAAIQSFLRFPLGPIMGSDGNIRVLRELFLHGGELSAPTIAARIRVSRQHVLRVLNALVALHVVEAVGVGGHPSYRVRMGHPLHDAIEALFDAERSIFEQVSDGILQATAVDPEPISVWLYGSVARAEDTAASDVDVAVVVQANELDRVADEIRSKLLRVEDSLGIAISLVAIDLDDISRLSDGDPWWDDLVRDAIVLSGPDPRRLAARQQEPK